MHGPPIGVHNISVMTLAEVAANMSKKHIVTVDQNILYFNGDLITSAGTTISVTL